MARRKQPAGSKPYLSPSQLDMACRCGEQYRRAYVEKDRCPPGIAQARGTAVHTAAAENFRQKITSGRDISIEDFKGIAAEAFDCEISGGISIGADDGNISVAIGEERDLVVDLAELHGRVQAPDYRRPVLVEAEFRIELPGPFDALGIIDLADDRRIVADLKTSRRKKKQADADSSAQLTMYAAGHKQLTGELPTEARLDVAVGTKTEAVRQVLSTERGPADFAALAARINAVAKAIEAGVFLPVDPGSWVCSPRYCGYFNNGCPYVNSERRAKVQDGE